MIKTNRLRCWIGVLGMLLPIIVLVLSVAYGFRFPNSISETYYISTCITPFMIILGAAGILLMNYSGYDKVDDILNTLAGIFALGVCFFPCYSVNAPVTVGTFNIPVALSDILHTISAICFFGILAYNSLFQFTKGAADPTLEKKKRNVIFRICGIGMIASFVLLPIVVFGIVNIPHVIWVIETIALFFFGISWLTKANCIPWLFADKKI
jgi:hypothetical protein